MQHACAEAPSQGFIDSFYVGRTLFLTGCTGFLGKVLLEKILRDLPQVKHIFVLVREKQDLSAEQRLHKEIFGSTLFGPLKEKLGPEGFEILCQKVTAVRGDILEEELGISEEDYIAIKQDVSVVIHCAATIQFWEPLKEAVNQNVLGSLRVLRLAQELRDCVIFTQVSTAYVNSDRRGFITEKIYNLEFDPEDMVNKILNMEDKELEKETKTLIGRHPNTYTFTKSISEHLLRKNRKNMPMAFCRPTIINGICRDPIPGWTDSLTAAGALYAAYGAGLVKFLPVSDPDDVTDQVPVDFVSNNIIAITAWNAGKNKLSLYHSGTSHQNPLPWKHLIPWLLPYWQTRPPKKGLGKPTFEFIYPYMSLPMYEIHYMVRWAIPVLMYRLYAKSLGTTGDLKRSKLLQKILAKMTKLTDTFRHFIENCWTFGMDNSNVIFAAMNESERDRFEYNAAAIDWPRYLFNYAYGLRKYAAGEKGLKPSIGDYLPPHLGNVGLSLKWRPFSDARFAVGNNIVFNVKHGLRSADEITRMVAKSARVQQVIKKYALEKGKDVAVVEKHVDEILNVMTAEASPTVVRSLAWMFRKIYRRLYSDVVINEVGIDSVKELFSQGSQVPVVFLPTHRSYIDFLILSYIFYSFSIPLPHIAAGNDFLNVVLVRWIFKKAGAFFMRRSFQAGDDAELYKAIFTEYTQTLVEDGCPLEFFVEGTRSRSGKMMQPKLGLLSIATDLYFEKRNGIKDMIMLPVNISYEKTVDEYGHIREVMGDSKQKPTLRGLLAAAKWVLALDFGRINVQIGTPIPLHQFSKSVLQPQLTTQPSTSLGLRRRPGLQPITMDQRKEIVKRLGYAVCRDLISNSVCMSTGLVASIVLTHRHGLSMKDIVKEYNWLRDRIIERGGWVDTIHFGVSYVVSRALKLLGDSVTKPERIMPNVSADDSKSVLHLAYYRNQVVHVFKDEAVVMISLASFGLERVLNPWVTGPFKKKYKKNGEKKKDKIKEESQKRNKNMNFVSKTELLEKIRFLHRLWREEWIPANDEFLDDSLGRDINGPWSAADKFYEEKIDFLVNNQVLAIKKDETDNEDFIYVPPSGEKYFSWICSLYWPFVDAYWIAGLATLSALPDFVVEEDSLLGRSQWLGERFFREGIISHYESISKDTIRNAFNVFIGMKVLERKKVSVRLQGTYCDSRVLEEFVDRISKYRKAERSWAKRKAPGRSIRRHELLADFPIVAKL